MNDYQREKKKARRKLKAMWRKADRALGLLPSTKTATKVACWHPAEPALDKNASPYRINSVRGSGAGKVKPVNLGGNCSTPLGVNKDALKAIAKKKQVELDAMRRERHALDCAARAARHKPIVKID